MAEKGKLIINIVTPVGEKLSAVADEIVAPGFLGEFGVMPGHVEYFVQNPPGVFTIINDGQKSHWALGKGFIEVGNDEVQLLVQSAEKAQDIDQERANNSKQRAVKYLEKLDGNLSDPNYEQCELRLNRAEARLEAAQLAK